MLKKLLSFVILTLFSGSCVFAGSLKSGANVDLVQNAGKNKYKTIITFVGRESTNTNSTADKTIQYGDIVKLSNDKYGYKGYLYSSLSNLGVLGLYDSADKIQDPQPYFMVLPKSVSSSSTTISTRTINQKDEINLQWVGNLVTMKNGAYSSVSGWGKNGYYLGIVDNGRVGYVGGGLSQSPSTPPQFQIAW